MPEPVAAATWYAQAERLAPGRTIAVYDLGGGTFDATVLRRRADGGFESLGRTEGIERLGGIDVDEAVFGYVLRTLGADREAREPQDGDPGEDRHRPAAAGLRGRQGGAVVGDVGRHPGVGAGAAARGAAAAGRAGGAGGAAAAADHRRLGPRVVASAGLRAADLDAVLLVGGS